MAQDLEDFGEKSSLYDASALITSFNQMPEYQGVRLTESLLNKLDHLLQICYILIVFKSMPV